ncbi:hypothetical protein ACVW0J_010033 [Bradyrhizobium sp. i1.7.7]
MLCWTCGSKLPAQFPGGGFEREHDLVRRAGVEQIAHLERRRLVGDLVGIIRTLVIVGAEFPSELQVLDVVRSDLAQRRIARAKGAAAIGGPVLASRGGGRLGGDRARCLARHQCAGEGVPIAGQGDGQHGDGSDQDDAEGASRDTPARAQMGSNERQHQRYAQGHQHIAARRQCPEIEAGFPDRPHHRAEQQRRIDPERLGAADREQPAREQQHGAGDQIIHRAAEHGEPGSAAGKCKAHDRDNHNGDGQPRRASKPVCRTMGRSHLGYFNV